MAMFPAPYQRLSEGRHTTLADKGGKNLCCFQTSPELLRLCKSTFISCRGGDILNIVLYLRSIQLFWIA